ILTEDRAAPAPGWDALTKTGRAKSAQRRLEKAARREEFARLGRDLVAHALHRYGHALADTSLEDAAGKLGKEDEEEIFFAVGEGSLKPAEVVVAAFPGLGERVKKDESRRPIDLEKARLYVKGSQLTPGVAFHFAECCSPIPGDRIIGVQIPGKGIEIH